MSEFNVQKYALICMRLAAECNRTISSAIGTGSTVLPSRADYEPWVSATSPLRRARRGRTALSRG
jgi:hypothetical protein